MTDPSSDLSSLATLLARLGLGKDVPPTPEQWSRVWAALEQEHAPIEHALTEPSDPCAEPYRACLTFGPQGRIMRVEPEFSRLLGYGPEIVGQELGNLMISPIEKLRFRVMLDGLSELRQGVDAELLLRHRDGERYLLACRLRPLLGAADDLQAFELSCSVCQPLLSFEYFGRSHFYEALLDAMPAPIVIFDEQLRYVYSNPAAIRNPEIRQWIIGKDDVEYVAYRRFDPELARRRQKFIRQAISERRTVHFEESFLTSTGDTVYQLRTNTPLFSPDGSLLFVVGHGLEITELKRAQEALRQLNNDLEKRVLARTAELEAMSKRLEYDAFHDSLTGLPNRALFTERLEQVLRKSGTPYAVLFLDTDRFKTINDTLGHPAGDELLRELAIRLRRVLRASDTVARLGGDEFGILLEPLHAPEQASEIVYRIQEALRVPIHLLNYEVVVSVSLGIVPGEIGYDSAAAILRDADIAMYRAKAAGRDGFKVFTPEMRQETVAMNLLDNELRAGLKRGELRVVYQGIVDLHTMRLTGFEALVRWQHPERGLLVPGDFIHVAEDTGLMLEIDRWVLREACEQMQAWRQKYPQQTYELSVNFSGRHFAVPGLVEYVAAVLAETGFPASLLNLEITEGALLAKPQAIGESLERLRRLGVQLHLDDFGTGYSSLSYLQTYPLDALKIDRSFISGMLDNPDSAELVRTIIAMAKNMKLCVVAEGIETPEQLRALQDLGCDSGQGYLFTRPLALAAAQQATQAFAATESAARRARVSFGAFGGTENESG